VRIATPVELQDVEADAVGVCCVAKVGTDIAGRHGDAGAEPVSGCERFEHRGGQVSSAGTVTGLKFGHEPGELAQRQDFDVGRQRGELGPELGLQVGGQAHHRGGELADDGRLRQRGAQPEEPQARGCEASGRQAAEVGGALTDEDIAQQVIVDDDGGQLRRGQVRVVQGLHEPLMLFGGQRIADELLTGARW
jgi:hypothetical protein